MTPLKPVDSTPSAAPRAEPPATAYVTVETLAGRWQVRPQDIHKLIDTGTLPALRFGPRSIRIRSKDAAAFETTSAFATLKRSNPNSGSLPEVPETDAIAKIAAEPQTS